jgi:predicted metal-binding membrane protein
MAARAGAAPSGHIVVQAHSGATAPGPRLRGGQRLALALVAAVAVPAWALLALWSASPYRGYLDHGGWGDAIALSPLCRAVPGGEVVVPALVTAFAWLLMIAAMMVPTALPLVGTFRRIVAGRPDAGRLVAAVLAGYVAAWMGFGIVAHAADAGVRAAAAGSPWLVAHAWVLGAGVLALAGAFQFSALKYRCLERCRTPFGFVNAHWHGRRPARESLRLGLAHGAFCVGCCWALMLVMFVVGMGNPGWMLVLAAAMAAEKNLPAGPRLRTPLGLGLLAWAAAIALARA